MPSRGRFVERWPRRKRKSAQGRKITLLNAGHNVDFGFAFVRKTDHRFFKAPTMNDHELRDLATLRAFYDKRDVGIVDADQIVISGVPY